MTQIMIKGSWDDYKVAYQVAIDGSLNKAGQSLNINHATVLRRINQLEKALEIKLFIRHQRGYKLTDAGHLLMDEMPELISRFATLENQLQNVEGNMNGELRITTISTYIPELSFILTAFRKQYPTVRIKLITTDALVPLDSGITHVALRVGPKPNGVDLIVKNISQIKTSFYAHESYVDLFGIPKNVSEFNQHAWVLPSEEKYHIPYINYVVKKIEKDNIIFQCNSIPDVSQAVIAGMGIGPISDVYAKQLPNLVPIPIDLPTDEEAIWCVYHKDLKHSYRIKCFYEFLINYKNNKYI